MIDKKAVKHLPQDLQDAINSFIKQNAKKFASSNRVQSLTSKYNMKDTVEYDCILKYDRILYYEIKYLLNY